MTGSWFALPDACDRRCQEDRYEQQQDAELGQQRMEWQVLQERREHDPIVVHPRQEVCDKAALGLQVRHRNQQPRVLDRGNDGEDDGDDDRRDLAADERRDDESQCGRRNDIQQRAGDVERERSLEGDTEDSGDDRAEHERVAERNHRVRGQLPEHELPLAGRRREKVEDRAELLLAGDGDRGHDRRRGHQDHGEQAGQDRVRGAQILVVEVAGAHLDGFEIELRSRSLAHACGPDLGRHVGMHASA